MQRYLSTANKKKQLQQNYNSKTYILYQSSTKARTTVRSASTDQDSRKDLLQQKKQVLGFEAYHS